MPKHKKTVVILSVSSDIGNDLARRYLAAGFRVAGTFRTKVNIKDLQKHPDGRLFYCDLAQKGSVKKFLQNFKRLGWSWDVFISCVGMPQPLTVFFKTDFDAWAQSVQVNSTEQLRILHGLYPYRNKKKINDVVFFAAGGTNNAVVDFSAYTISKIMLIKMCEFLDAENRNLNIFITGPGWTKTKIHYKMLTDPHISVRKRAETVQFLKNRQGTNLSDIFECIEWLRRQGKKVASGRNFSVAFDPWKGPQGAKLAALLKSDPEMFKLKRHKSDLKGVKGFYAQK